MPFHLPNIAPAVASVGGGGGGGGNGNGKMSLPLTAKGGGGGGKRSLVCIVFPRQSGAACLRGRAVPFCRSCPIQGLGGFSCCTTTTCISWLGAPAPLFVSPISPFCTKSRKRRQATRSWRRRALISIKIYDLPFRAQNAKGNGQKREEKKEACLCC